MFREIAKFVVPLVFGVPASALAAACFVAAFSPAAVGLQAFPWHYLGAVVVLACIARWIDARY